MLYTFVDTKWQPNRCEAGGPPFTYYILLYLLYLV